MPYNEQQLRVCNRTGDIIEPMIKKQWFMNCINMNDTALEAIERGLVMSFVHSLILVFGSSKF